MKSTKRLEKKSKKLNAKISSIHRSMFLLQKQIKEILEELDKRDNG